MTDKIIIDGTQCRYAHFDGGNTQRLLCAIDDCFCDCYRENDCYYKQLKRKEQECEELKEHHYELEEKFLELNVKAYSNTLELDQLKSENEELKREIDIRSCANIELSDEVKKYRKAIDEIEEIADNNYEIAEMEQIFLIIGGLDV